MKRRILLASLVALTTVVLTAAFTGGEVNALPPPIGCGADGYCNPFCTDDPDCGPPQCNPGTPCRSDFDCQPMGYCAVYRLCVCTG